MLSIPAVERQRYLSDSADCDVDRLLIVQTVLRDTPVKNLRVYATG